MTEFKEQGAVEELRKKGAETFFKGLERWFGWVDKWKYDKSGLAQKLKEAVDADKAGVEQWMYERSQEGPGETYQNWNDFLDFLGVEQEFNTDTPDNTRLKHDFSSGIDEMLGLPRRGDSVGT